MRSNYSNTVSTTTFIDFLLFFYEIRIQEIILNFSSQQHDNNAFIFCMLVCLVYLVSLELKVFWFAQA